MRSKVKTREELLNIADNYSISRYDDGRINNIEARKGKTLLDKTQALYANIAGLTRLNGVNGFLFPEVWNSLETPELNWFDRNPKTIIHTFSTVPTGAIAPHAEVGRWIYSVPNNRKFFLETAQCSILRETEANVQNLTTAILYYSDGSTLTSLLTAMMWNKVIGAQTNNQLGQAVLLFEGEHILGKTQDLSTLGTCNYMINIKGTEFDA
jgi:hypothetical protein